jgi:hypothetical protein
MSVLESKEKFRGLSTYKIGLISHAPTDDICNDTVVDQDAVPMIVGKEDYDGAFSLRNSTDKKKAKKNDRSHSQYPANRFPIIAHDTTSS